MATDRGFLLQTGLTCSFHNSTAIHKLADRFRLTAFRYFGKEMRTFIVEGTIIGGDACWVKAPAMHESSNGIHNPWVEILGTLAYSEGALERREISKLERSMSELWEVKALWKVRA